MFRKIIRNLVLNYIDREKEKFEFGCETWKAFHTVACVLSGVYKYK